MLLGRKDYQREVNESLTNERLSYCERIFAEGRYGYFRATLFDLSCLFFVFLVLK